MGTEKVEQGMDVKKDKEEKKDKDREDKEEKKDKEKEVNGEKKDKEKEDSEEKKDKEKEEKEKEDSEEKKRTMRRKTWDDMSNTEGEEGKDARKTKRMRKTRGRIWGNECVAADRNQHERGGGKKEDVLRVRGKLAEDKKKHSWEGETIKKLREIVRMKSSQVG